MYNPAAGYLLAEVCGNVNWEYSSRRVEKYIHIWHVKCLLLNILLIN